MIDSLSEGHGGNLVSRSARIHRNLDKTLFELYLSRTVYRYQGTANTSLHLLKNVSHFLESFAKFPSRADTSFCPAAQMEQARPVTVVVEAKLRHGLQKEIAIAYCMHQTVSRNELEECERRLKDMNRTKGACCDDDNYHRDKCHHDNCHQDNCHLCKGKLQQGDTQMILTMHADISLCRMLLR